MRPVSLFRLLIRRFISTITGMNVDGRNYKWTGKVAAVLCVVLIYVGSYCVLRQHYTGNRVSREGYSVNKTSQGGGIQVPPFGRNFPQTPLGLHNALNIVFYPIQQADLSLTDQKMIFFATFPKTPPYPDFYPTR